MTHPPGQMGTVTWVLLPMVVIAVALVGPLITIEVKGLVRANRTGAFRQSFAKGPISDGPSVLWHHATRPPMATKGTGPAHRFLGIGGY
jgi:hypothetical protein